MKKILSNDEMKNIFGGSYINSSIERWESGVGGGGGGGGLIPEAFGNLWRWVWSWFN